MPQPSNKDNMKLAKNLCNAIVEHNKLRFDNILKKITDPSVFNLNPKVSMRTNTHAELTPLSLVCFDDLFDTATAQYFLNALLEKKADPNFHCLYTPLGICANKLKHELAVLLLQSGAKLRK